MPNKSLAIAKSRKEVAILNGKPNRRCKTLFHWLLIIHDYEIFLANGQFHNCQSWLFKTAHGQF